MVIEKLFVRSRNIQIGIGLGIGLVQAAQAVQYLSVQVKGRLVVRPGAKGFRLFLQERKRREAAIPGFRCNKSSPAAMMLSASSMRS